MDEINNPIVTLKTIGIKFCSEAYFSGLRFLNEPEISDSGSSA